MSKDLGKKKPPTDFGERSYKKAEDFIKRLQKMTNFVERSPKMADYVKRLQKWDISSKDRSRSELKMHSIAIVWTKTSKKTVCASNAVTLK